MGEAGAAARAVPWAGTFILFFAHFVVDSQSGFFAPLLPLLREKLQFSLATAGVLISLQSVSSALSQPVTALVVDRWPRAPWLAVGLVGSSLAFTAVGWLPSLAGVAVAVPLGGILFGLCHPDMASRAGRLGGTRSSLVVSVFITGGRLGFAAGPIVAIAVAQAWGMEWLWTYVLVALAAMVAVVRGLPAPPPPKPGAGSLRGAGGVGEAIRRAGWPLAFLFGVAVIRATTLANLQGFVPTLFVDLGLGLWRGGFGNAIVFFSGAFGVMLGGVLGDRFDRRSVITAGMTLALFGMLGFLVFPFSFAYFFLAVVGAGVFIPMGVSTALVQEYLPDHRGFASSLTLGGGWFIASFTSVPIAAAAERFGLLQMFWVLPPILAIGVLFALGLPREGRRG